MDRSKLDQSNGNISTSNALVDPDSNRKNKRESSFKSQKSNRSNNASKQDDEVREKDIKLEMPVVGEEVKEDDENSVAHQYADDSD